jgi:hypothetical protein
MAGLELAVALAQRRGVYVEIIERGPALRRDHVEWDRASYPGDQKSRHWSGAGWGAGGGLSERLGGRSLCYHGVFLGIEPQALRDWPPGWQRLLGGEDALYQAVPAELRSSSASRAP